METTGYINLASTNDNVHPRQYGAWHKWSSLGIMRLLPAILMLAVVGMADQALAARPGDRGGEVSSIQRCLRQIGVYNGPITGFYGPQTETAVRQFQSRNRIQAIGVVGPQTQRALQSRCQAGRPNPGNTGNNSNELRVGSSGNRVLRLQQNLRLLGFYNGPVNGNFGNQTQQAVIRFQSYYGLRADGVVGGRTLAMINNQVTAINRPTEPSNGGGMGGPIDEYPDALNLGDRGQLVTKLQDDLRMLGYFRGDSTGYFGSVTRDAVLRFQRDRNLFTNGIADFNTLQALANVLANRNPGNTNSGNGCSPMSGNICLGERSQRVQLVQQRLLEWGFLAGNADGLYGNATREAVIQFQNYTGLSRTGIVDFQTWQALGLSNSAPNANNPRPVSNSYVVAIPVQGNDTLNRVRQFVPQARQDRSRKGDFVNAGAFRDRSDAEKLTRKLRDRGFDARVEYIN